MTGRGTSLLLLLRREPKLRRKLNILYCQRAHLLTHIGGQIVTSREILHCLTTKPTEIEDWATVER
jgi:hypothetical protein